MDVAYRYIGVVTVLGGFLYYYGVFDWLIKKYGVQTPQASRTEPAEKTAKKKRARNKVAERVTSSSDSASTNEKKRQISSPVAGTVTASINGKEQSVALPRADGEDMSALANRDFARELAKAQQGTKLSSSGKQGGAKSTFRTVKQKLADQDSPHMSAENSSTGQDGDDETTPAGSPAFMASTSEAVPDTTGVSDMLEPAKEGPKALRIVGDWQEAQSKKLKPAAKPSAPVETKKQRQQRRKREEEKERIAQSNKEHDAKLQQQLRAARMAGGISKQTKADAFKAPPSPWTATGIQNTDSAVKQPPTDVVSTAPLDTFEPDPKPDVGNKGAATTQAIFSSITNGRSTSTGANGLKKEIGNQRTSALAAPERKKTSESSNPLQRTESWAEMVDEEEQMKWAAEDPAAWEPVTTKKDKKKARKEDGETDGNSTKRMNGQDQKPEVPSNTNGISSQSQSRPRIENRYGSLVAEGTNDDVQEDTWEA